MDINSIMNGSSIIGDKITSKQKKVFKKAKKKKSMIPLFSDWDGDRVINALDCAPKNKRKHAYWKPMDPEEQKRMRDEAIQQHYQDKGYYKYGGPTRMQGDDLEESRNMFSENPVQKYTGMTSKIRRYREE